MSWKRNKLLFKENYPDETQFIIGIDLGNATSSIAYFDVVRKTTEIIDVSGGYGKPNLPTVVQYVADNKDWVFGEYALLNNNEKDDIKITSIIKKLGKKEYFNIENKSVSLVNILSLYIKELINNCKNLNPKANIAGIVISVPSYLEEESLQELRQAINIAGFDKYLIDFFSNRECLLAKHVYENEIINQKIMILDFGSREVRGDLINIKKNGEEYKVDCVSSLKNKKLGEKIVENSVYDFFEQFFLSQKENKITKSEKEQLLNFVYASKELLFQKNITKKPIKLYYNFIHPPFMQSVNYDDVKKIIGNFEKDFKQFIFDILEKSFFDDKKIDIEKIDKIYCTGGGFEMLWVRALMQDIFGKDKVNFNKNSKGIIAQGAAIVAASELSIIKKINFEITDNNLLKYDIGINIFKENQIRFFPIVEKDSFWSNKIEPITILMNEENINDLSILSRDFEGEVKNIAKLNISDFPKRPKGTNKIKLKLNFAKQNLLKIEVEDYGFGELFKKTDYTKEFIVNV